MSKEWKSGEAIYHMKQAERNALDVAAMNKLNEMLDIAQLRTTITEQKARINALESEVFSQQDQIDRIEQKQRCHSKYATRPILYTDGVNGEQCCRDDLWAISTEELNRIKALEDALRESSDVLCNCEEAFEETRDFPLTLKDVREAVSKINELIGE